MTRFQYTSRYLVTERNSEEYYNQDLAQTLCKLKNEDCHCERFSVLDIAILVANALAFQLVNGHDWVGATVDIVALSPDDPSIATFIVANNVMDHAGELSVTYYCKGGGIGVELDTWTGNVAAEAMRWKRAREAFWNGKC